VMVVEPFKVRVTCTATQTSELYKVVLPLSSRLLAKALFDLVSSASYRPSTQVSTT
jgi:hypothetical protein